jgi:hypothetical protein
MKMSRIPSPAMTSASETLATVIPAAPASSCSLASLGILCVLTWGRNLTPSSLARSDIFSMLLFIFKTSIKRCGVSTIFPCSPTPRTPRSIVVARRSRCVSAASLGEEISTCSPSRASTLRSSMLVNSFPMEICPSLFPLAIPPP